MTRLAENIESLGIEIDEGRRGIEKRNQNLEEIKKRHAELKALKEAGVNDRKLLFFPFPQDFIPKKEGKKEQKPKGKYSIHTQSSNQTQKGIYGRRKVTSKTE